MSFALAETTMTQALLAAGQSPTGALLMPVPEMHVVFVIYNADAGGSVLATTRKQAEYLAKCGAMVRVVSNSCPTDWQGVECRCVPAFGSRPWQWIDYALVGASRRLLRGRLGKRLDMYRVLPQALFPFSAARAVADIHEERHVDCCVCCQHVMALGLKRVLKSLSIPLVLVAHGDIFEHPADAFSIPMTALYRRAARVSYRSADHVIAVSRQVRDRAVSCGARPDKASVIPNGIDFSDITGGKCQATPRRAECEILFVGRLSPEKAPDVMLSALAELRDVPFRLRVVGSGPMEAHLKALAKQLDLDTKCDFTGSVPRNELAGYYLSSDVLVLPSLAEAQSVVALEAQVCGVPVVASNVGGIPEVVEHGRNGFLVPAGNSSAMAAAIGRLCEDDELRRQMSQQARLAAGRFAWPPLLERFGHVCSSASWAQPPQE